MKNNWQTKELGEVLEYEQPTPYIVSSKNYKEEYETPVLTAGKSFILGKTKEKSGIFPKDKLPVIIFDDFTTATQFVDFPFKVKSSAMKILHPVKKISDAKFLFYLIQTINFNYKGIHKRYWISEYSKIKILLPPLSEQQRIVKILDETFEKIEKAKENTEKNLKNSKELFESYLNNIFASSCNDWCEKKISDVCDVSAGNSAPQKKELFVGGKYPFFRTSDVGRIHIGIISDSSDYLNDKGIKGLRLFNKGTILLPKSGASTFLNHRVVLGIDGYVSSHLATIKTDKNILNNNYLFYFLQRIKAQDLIQDHRYPSLNLPVIGGIKISYPSLSEQKSIVTRLDKLSVETKKLKSIYKQKLADLEELKKSILKKAFNGEL